MNAASAGVPGHRKMSSFSFILSSFRRVRVKKRTPVGLQVTVVVPRREVVCDNRIVNEKAQGYKRKLSPTILIMPFTNHALVVAVDFS